MIIVSCDKCSKDSFAEKERCFYEIRVMPIHNTVPTSYNDFGEPQITDSANDHIRFILCQKCYAEMGLPNVYSTRRSGKLDWRDEL